MANVKLQPNVILFPMIPRYVADQGKYHPFIHGSQSEIVRFPVAGSFGGSGYASTVHPDTATYYDEQLNAYLDAVRAHFSDDDYYTQET